MVSLLLTVVREETMPSVIAMHRGQGKECLVAFEAHAVAVAAFADLGVDGRIAGIVGVHTPDTRRFARGRGAAGSAAR